jgi:hypothetical protein
VSSPQATQSPGSTPVGGDTSSKSVGELLGEITSDLSTLMRQEVALAKAEAAQSAKRAGKGAGLGVGAVVAAHFTILFLSIALWWWLGTYISHGWSAVVVAVLWAIAATVMALTAKREFTEIRGLDRTAETLKKIPNAIKGNEEENR